MISTRATISPVTAIVRGAATHPEDDLVLATAVSARADCLVTGDRQLQRLGSYQGVSILSPALFSSFSTPDRSLGSHGAERASHQSAAQDAAAEARAQVPLISD
jgi:hypothetical protein